MARKLTLGLDHKKSTFISRRSILEAAIGLSSVVTLGLICRGHFEQASDDGSYRLSQLLDPDNKVTHSASRISDFCGINSTGRSIGPFGAASHSQSVKAVNQSCALCMAVKRADLAVFGVRGVEITRLTKFQVVKKTAQ